MNTTIVSPMGSGGFENRLEELTGEALLGLGHQLRRPLRRIELLMRRHALVCQRLLVVVSFTLVNLPMTWWLLEPAARPPLEVLVGEGTPEGIVAAALAEVPARAVSLRCSSSASSTSAEPSTCCCRGCRTSCPRKRSSRA